MVRLSEAHARLMFHDEVTIQDAIIAVCVIESSMHNTALIGDSINPLHTSFPEVGCFHLISFCFVDFVFVTVFILLDCVN